MERKKVPSVRFRGFSDQWEQKNVGDVLTERKIFQKISDDAPILAFAAGQGVIDRSERKSNNRDHLTLDQANKFYKLTEYDDIVYNPSNLKYGAIDRNKHGRGVISPIYVTFTSEENSSFIEPIVKSEKFKLKALVFEEGTVVKRQSVKPENLLSLDINITSIPDEQALIGEFFSKLDRMIIQHQRRYEKLVTLKNAMLGKMFPQDGASVPEIRFKGFSQPWEEKTLGEIGETQSGIGFPDSEQGGGSGIPFFKVSDMSNIGNENEMKNANNYVSKEQIERKGWKPILKIPGVIFAKVGAAIMLNRKRLVRSPFLIDNNLMAYLFDDSWDMRFGKTLFETINLPSYAQTGALPSYNGGDIENITISIPVKKEQAKIGMYFWQLDNLITQYGEQMIKLKKIKIACLEKMFV